MINKIEIVNFRSHKRTILRLSPGVNVIVGETDSGKSAIVSALRWVITNRPVGDSFRSNWGGKTAVSIHTDEGVVTRFKDDKNNRYTLYTQSDGQEIVFNAIKTEVPREVLDFLGVTDVNLQTQFDSHFLLSSSPGEVAQHFNRVAHLDKIDVGLKNLQKWVNTLQHAIRSDEDELNRLQGDLSTYDNIDRIETKVAQLETIDEDLKEAKYDIVVINDTIEEVKRIEREIQADSKIVEEAGPIFDEVWEYHIQLREKYDDLKKGKELVYDIGEINEEIIRAERILPAGKVIDDLLQLEKKIQDTEFQIDKLHILVDYLERVTTSEEKLAEDLEEYEEEFHLNLGKTCPLCGQKIK